MGAIGSKLATVLGDAGKTNATVSFAPFDTVGGVTKNPIKVSISFEYSVGILEASVFRTRIQGRSGGGSWSDITESLPLEIAHGLSTLIGTFSGVLVVDSLSGQTGFRAVTEASPTTANGARIPLSNIAITLEQLNR